MLDILNTFVAYPDIICLSETRLKGGPYINVALEDYDLIYFNSTTNAGGVAVYISKNFVIQSISKQDLQVENCEDLWLRISVRNMSILFTLGVLYRHPHHSTNKFIESLNDKLADFNSSKTTYILYSR